MNWSIGFLRLWIVVSAVYVALVLSIMGIGKLKGLWRPSSNFEVEFTGGVTRRFNTALERDTLRKQIFDAVLAASTAQLQKGDKAASQKLINEQDETVRDLIKAMDDQDRSKWQDAKIVSATAFGPPIALLLTGFLIGWIIKGFPAK